MGITLYASTVIFSMTVENLNKFKYVKKLADMGYKIDDYKIFTLSSLVNFIPLINLFTSLRNVVIYKILKIISNDQLLKLGNIIPFTQEEKELYQKSSSIYNAINLNVNNFAKPNMILIYMEKSLENIIYFTVENKQKIIISTKGPISKLTKQKQYEILQKRLEEVYFSVEIKTHELQNNINSAKKNTIYKNLNILNNNFNYQNFDETKKSKVYTKRFIK